MPELPTGWVEAEIGELGASDRPAVKAGPFGSSLKKAFYVASGYRVYGQEQVIADDLSIGDYYIDEARFETLRSCEVRPGDILVSLVGTFGRVAVVPEGIEPGIINPRLIRLSLDPRLVDPTYLKKLFRSPQVQKHFEKTAHGGTMGVLNGKTLKPTRVPLAPLNEQRRIVAKIESLFERSRRAKEALDAIPPLLDKLRQSILAAAFRGDLTADWRVQNPNVEPADKLLERIRTERRDRWEQTQLAKMRAKGKEPKNDKWKVRYKVPDLAPPTSAFVNELPNDWAAARVGELALVMGGKRLPKGSALVHEDTGFPYIRAGNLKGGTVGGQIMYLKPEDQAQIPQYTVRAGDMYITNVGACIGDAGVIPTTFDGANLTENAAKIAGINHIEQDYFALILRSPQVQSQVQRLIMSAAQGKLALSRIETLQVPLCPQDEQLQIVNVVNNALAQVRQLEANLAQVSGHSRSLDQSILAKAFRGELVEQNPNDEPASELLKRIRTVREATNPVKKKKAKRRIGGKKNAEISG